MSKLQKRTLLKHAMVTADNAEQFILEGCNRNIKRGRGLIGQFPSTMGSAGLYNRQHACAFLAAPPLFPDMEMCARQRVWRRSQSWDWLRRGLAKTRQACLLLRHLNFLPLAAMGQSHPPLAHPADSDIHQNPTSHLQTCASRNPPDKRGGKPQKCRPCTHLDGAAATQILIGENNESQLQTFQGVYARRANCRDRNKWCAKHAIKISITLRFQR